MPGVNISVDLGSIRADIDELTERQVPYIASLALNAVAQEIVAGEQATMSEVFDRPVEWTLNSLAITPSHKSQGDTLIADVHFREFAGKGTPAWKYLDPEIGGGFRRRKSHELRLLSAGIMRPTEYAVPGAGVRLDQHGNMPAALITQVLSQLQASSDAMRWQTKRSRARHQAQGGAVYFVRRQAGAPAGIYQRLSGRRIKPIIIFVRTPSYGERFPIYGRAREIVSAKMLPTFWRIWKEQLPRFRR